MRDCRHPWRPIFPLAAVLFYLALPWPQTGAVAGQGRSEVPERIIAIGDLHGDLDAAVGALRLGGAIDEEHRWIGGDLVVVQTGDILDRGDDEEEIMDLLQRLRYQADAAGGAVHILNGNHELMNAAWDFRYVTERAFADSSDFRVTVDLSDSTIAALPPMVRKRASAFKPGQNVALFLAQRNTAVIVGRSVFVHGGILPEHVEMGLGRMNVEIQLWLLGETPQPEWVSSERSPVWTRLYSNAPDSAACDTLDAVLKNLDLDRMVVGHTVQPNGITSYCEGKVWCIDVGMAKHYGGRPEVLEIRGDTVRAIR
jgi:hypothetical protein